jgi:glycosyltransferase involved in cell wall biosynthesis
MKIAQVAPLWERVPPKLYGGTERIVSSLTEHLLEMGHDVTLYATGDSVTKAHLKSVYPRSLFRDGIPWTDLSYPLLNITNAFEDENEYDLIHIHLNKLSDYISLPLAVPFAKKVVFTLHFPYPLSQNRISRHEIFQKYKNLNYISISEAQRSGGENLNWIGTVYNGIETENYTFHKNPKDYFVWLGKFNPDKGVKEAITAAKKAKVRLLLAGKIDNLESDDMNYFKVEIKPFIDGDQIQYVGEADDQKKNDIFGNAIAFLNPIKWNEPFGLVMVESMATGTPVISYANGAAPELIKNGKTGFLVSNVDEMLERMLQISSLNRNDCRKHVLAHFSAKVMTKNYEKVFEKLMEVNSR